MRIVRLSSLMILAAAASAGALLFWTSQNVQEQESQMQALQMAIAKEKQSIRVLNAEWDYLNRPERLESLAAKHMGLGVPLVDQVGMGAKDLPMPFSLIPPVKPDFSDRLTEPLPAVYSPEASPPSASPKKPTPPQAPSEPTSSRSFQTLLEDLEEGAR